MGISVGVALCVAYIVGLLLGGTFGAAQFGVVVVSWGGILIFLMGLLYVAIAPRRLKLGLRPLQWVAIASIALLASFYMQIRAPQPGLRDISQYVERVQAIATTQTISGKVIDEPSLNRGLKGRFRIQANQLAVEDATGTVTFQIPVHGKLYVTAPLLQVTGLHSGMEITATGRLYLPQAALNPNGFDFKAYLTQRSTFAGLVAEKLDFADTAPWGLWQIRQRIVRSLVKALGSPFGQLVSAMSLGRRAVDLPYDIQDLFSQVGLAHTLAASGFQVSLLLGCVLGLLRSRSVKLQLISGSLVLIIFTVLAGLEASVVRAVLMGFAGLIGLAADRKTKPVGVLLVVVTLMLVWDPQWLWNIGFQLSVTATLGLIVMATDLTKKLDWLPLTLAAWIAVPLAATLWTLPLMLYHFNVISGISIGLNAIATPIITFISLGGIGSSALSLLSPPMGGGVAHILYFPTQALVWLARASSHLPGSSVAIGQISLWQMLGLYTVLLLSTRLTQKTLLQASLPISFLALIVVPMGWSCWTQNQITVLAAGDELVWLLQDHGQVTLVNSGNEKAAFYTVGPFLQQAGVNQLENAIALPFAKDYLAGWQSLLRQTPTKNLYSSSEISPLPDVKGQYHTLKIGQRNSLKNLVVQPLGIDNPILRLAASETSWLLLPSLPLELQTHLAKAGAVLQSQVLVWGGDGLSKPLLDAVHPEVAICYGRTLSESLERELINSSIQVYWTPRDGAVSWTNPKGFQSYLETKHRNSLPWG